MKPTLILTIRNHATQGTQILGNRWLPFIEQLREELSQQGVEHRLSSDTLLVFTFTGHCSIFSALLSAIEKSKQTYQWPEASGPTPTQFIIDLLQEDIPVSKSSLPNSNLWDEIQQETIYIGSQLQENWPEFANREDFPRHKLSKDSSGLAKITFGQYEIGKQESLLSYRNLPVSGKGKECFYCGMTSHHPSQCPAKMLGMDSWGLGELGYLGFDELNTLYKKVFPEKPAIVEKLREGIKTVHLRKNKELLVFVSFFDLSVVFQPRFLWNYAFSSYTKWSTFYQTDSVKIDNRNLHLALDCLRVGQYEQAEELLQNELKRDEGNKFAANIALAYLSLECDRNSDVGRYLEIARNSAKTTAEAIFANLVLSRHYEIIKDFWNAKEVVTNALKADYDCLDVQYRRIQLSVHENNLNDREIKQLRSLIIGQKDIFIRALLDPALLSIQGILDETLSQQYKTISFDATQNLAGAISEVEKLSIWLDDGDKRNVENKQAINHLQTQLHEQSYFHQLDIAERANGLLFTCQRLRKNQADKLTTELSRYHRQLDKYLQFWEKYPYKKFNTRFYPTANQAFSHCRKARKLLNETSTSATQKAIELSKEVKKGYAQTKTEYGRLVLIRTIMNGLKLFSKRILICECAGLLIMALVFPAINATLADSSSFEWLIQLTTDSGIQRKSMFLTTLFIAPLLALSWTLIELQRE